MRFVLPALLTLSLTCAADEPSANLAILKPIPDRLVVLTFDDSVKSHHTIARPLLKEYSFGATFFIAEGFDFKDNKKDYMTWEEIRELHEDGFEIGNHTRDHVGITNATVDRLAEQLDGIAFRWANIAIVISDGSNTTIKRLRRFHNLTLLGIDAFTKTQEMNFSRVGVLWTCICWMKRRYASTLAWGLTREKPTQQAVSASEPTLVPRMIDRALRLLVELNLGNVRFLRLAMYALVQFKRTL